MTNSKKKDQESLNQKDSWIKAILLKELAPEFLREVIQKLYKKRRIGI